MRLKDPARMQSPPQHSVSPSPRASAWPGWLALLAVGACALLALALVVDTASMIWMYGFSELHADQFNQYRTLLENEFLLGLALPANGHRHLISNIVRWLDIALFRGDQTAGIVAGLLTWLAAWAILSLQVWRVTVGLPLQRAAALLLTGLALAWLGSARVQLHGNEAPQVYFVVCCALLAMACIADRERATAGRWALALALGVLGMLAFGSGVAIFGGLLALAVVLRHPPLRVAAATAAAIGAVLVYSVLLPGGDSVRSTVTLQPLVVLGNAATWLGSAITTGWLVWGGEGSFGKPVEAFAAESSTAAWLVASASALRGLAGGASTPQLAQLCGAAGMLLLSLFGAFAWWRPQRLSPLARVGLGIGLFTAALAVLVSIGRSEYFVTFPDQLLADRYVMWTALFWLGLCLLGSLAARSRLAGWAGLVLVGLLVVAAWPSHQTGANWGRAAARVMEARAAQAQAGVLLLGWPGFSNLGDIGEVQAFLDFYEAREQAMFRTPRSRLLGMRLADDLVATADAGAVLDWYPHEEAVVTPENSVAGQAWHVAGHLFAGRAAEEGVVALDADRRVVGLGEFSYDHDGAWLSRIDDVARGFDLYLLSPVETACPAVTLYRIDGAASRLEKLAPLACARERSDGP
jgi:hypothetical protein